MIIYKFVKVTVFSNKKRRLNFFYFFKEPWDFHPTRIRDTGCLFSQNFYSSREYQPLNRVQIRTGLNVLLPHSTPRSLRR